MILLSPSAKSAESAVAFLPVLPQNAEVLPKPLIVLAHGMFGFGDVSLGTLKFSYFHKIDRALLAAGYPLIVPRVHPTASIRTRATQLKRRLLPQLELLQADQRVIIIAHSMGGLDARYMISKLGMADRVAALLTVCTPHHGSPYADWCLANLGRRLGGLKLARLLGLDFNALRDLTTTRCSRFNTLVPDHPDVRYFSISAARPWHRMPPVFYLSNQLIHAVEGANDGLVSVASATWGTPLGTWSADHLHTINKRFRPELGERTGDVSPLYLDAIARVLRTLRDKRQPQISQIPQI